MERRNEVDSSKTAGKIKIRFKSFIGVQER